MRGACAIRSCAEKPHGQLLRQERESRARDPIKAFLCRQAENVLPDPLVSLGCVQAKEH